METNTIKENLGLIPEIKTMLSEVKALFTTEKVEAKVEAKAEDAPVAEPVAEPIVEAKVEFNHVEFTEGYEKFKTSVDEKFVAFEAQITAANETIAKQDEMLKKTFALVEKVLEAPVALSTQKKKEGVKINADPLSKEELEKFRNLK